MYERKPLYVLSGKDKEAADREAREAFNPKKNDPPHDESVNYYAGTPDKTVQMHLSPDAAKDLFPSFYSQRIRDLIEDDEPEALPLEESGNKKRSRIREAALWFRRSAASILF